MFDSSILTGLVAVFALVGATAFLGSVSDGLQEILNDGCAFALERNETGACVEVKDGWGWMANESEVLESHRRAEEYEPPPPWVKVVGPVATVALIGGLIAFAHAMENRDDRDR